MRCAHCGFACTAKGQDMTQETFTKALQLAVDFSSWITLGGGEPLIHPLFEDFAWQAVRAMMSQSEECGFSAVGVVTNGKCTEQALNLARMARLGFISARLSLDEWHEKIEERVISAFRKSEYQKKDDHDLRAIGGASAFNIIPAGRAKGWGSNQFNRKCFCDSVIIVPNGTIYHCGCRKRSYGNINDPALSLPEYFGDVLSEDSCSRDFVAPEPENLVLQG